METYELKMKCSCGSEELLLEMEENALQIHIGSSSDGENKLVLECKECGAKIMLEVIKKPEENVSEEIRNEG